MGCWRQINDFHGCTRIIINRNNVQNILFKNLISSHRTEIFTVPMRRRPRKEIWPFLPPTSRWPSPPLNKTDTGPQSGAEEELLFHVVQDILERVSKVLSLIIEQNYLRFDWKPQWKSPIRFNFKVLQTFITVINIDIDHGAYPGPGKVWSVSNLISPNKDPRSCLIKIVEFFNLVSCSWGDLTHIVYTT